MQSDLLTVADIAALLDLPLRDIWRLRRESLFPIPIRDDDGHDRWERQQIDQWARSRGHKPAARYRLEDLRTAAKPCPYLGIQFLSNFAVLTWDTDYGRVCLVYPFQESHFHRETLSKLLPHAFSIVLVSLNDLIEFEPSRPENSNYVDADDLRRTLGRPIPYWPISLRIPSVMRRWDPDESAVLEHPKDEIDESIVLELANEYPHDHPVGTVLRYIVRRRRHQGFLWAESDIEDWEQSSSVTIAARPIPAPAPPAEPTGRDNEIAWAEIFSREDDLASRCAKEAYGWVKGRLQPFSTVTQIYQSGNVAAEWIASLEACSWRAEFARLGASRGDALFHDPATGLPAYRPDRDNRYFAALPHQLPGESPLQSLILDGDAWIRTRDGKLYLAPGGEGINATWGYGGTGPSYLANLIYRLLENIRISAFDAIDDRTETPQGLLDLMRMKHENGTVLDRRDLESATRSKV